MVQKKFSFFYLEGIEPQSFSNYKKDEEGIEWIGVQSGLIRYDPKMKKGFLIDSIHFHNKEDYPVQDVILLSNNYLLAAIYDKGLLLVNRKTLAFKEFSVHDINPESPLPIIGAANLRMDCTYKLNDSIILCSCSGGLTT